ncbi:hypothetical protein MHO82_24475 [Vibrio sp. Of7-15]|uniref:hypothetical protein n=1 Tax=Vibrio sp. Of7-15 TaxID=2724879 RepID=UPI001EF2E6C9|nr:hypothetical protein [Vibrio sp. Of7-15]MCG7500023.1 hypothetical protein [Vibrio sp. Of7-15]
MTVQIKELLCIDELTVAILENPTLPEHSVVAQERPNDNTVIDLFSGTACWRGYRGTWSIVDDKLYLNEVEGGKKLLSDGPLFADWYSGTLTIEEPDNRLQVIVPDNIKCPYRVILEVREGKVENRYPETINYETYTSPSMSSSWLALLSKIKRIFM